jgi:UDP-N-acetylglucosamine--N-acetylmuramyl-(pentapeptide) pyrophosphoryl-undecaprenol N-acetylglucosamine transferase
MRVIVSGGGTAGHISPTLATVDALTSLANQNGESLEVLYIGQASSMEAKIVVASGIAFAAIPAGKFRRNQAPGQSRLSRIANTSTIGPNIRDLGRVLRGIVASLKVLRKFKPDVIFLKGGYVCLPVGIAARILQTPFIIHESDLTPGLTNKILSRWATTIAVGFPIKSYREWPIEKLAYTGTPVRLELLKAHRLEGLAKFQIQSDLPVVLVTGGSQGAAQINDAVVAALPELLEFCQIIHQTGEGELARIEFLLARAAKLKHRNRYQAVAFLSSDMGMALAAADVVVGRAGVGTITDSALLGKPTVLIPNTQMAGHQIANAQLLGRSGAARVIAGNKLTPQGLVGELKRLLSDTKEQENLSKAIRQYAKPDAAKELAGIIYQLGHVREGER